MDACVAAIQNFLSRVARMLDLVMDNLIMEILLNAVILLNTIAIAVRDPKQTGLMRDLILGADFYARWIFTAEIAAKFISKGLIINKTAYLRSGWGVFDTIIVLSRWIDMRAPFGNLLFLRILSLYKLIFQKENDKLAKKIDIFRIGEQTWYVSSKVLVETIVLSAMQVIQVVILLIFTMLLFGVLGINLIAGTLRKRCAYPLPYGEYYHSDSGYTRNFSLLVPVQSCSNAASCPGPQWDQPTRVNFFDDHKGGLTCVDLGDEPPNGHFCDIGGAAVLVFQTYYTDGWTEGMRWAMDSVHPGIAALWVILIIFGAFYLMSLTVATTALRYGQLAQQYENMIKRIKEEREKEAAEAAGEGGDGGGGGDDDDSDDDSDSEEGDDDVNTDWGRKMKAEKELVEKILAQESGGGCLMCVKFLLCFRFSLVMLSTFINKCFFCCKLMPPPEKFQNSSLNESIPIAYKQFADKITMLTFLRPRESLPFSLYKYTALDLANTVNVLVWFGTLAANSEGISTDGRHFIKYLLLAQCGLFILLVLVKYIGHQNFLLYIQQSGNMLDCFVVAATLIGTAFSEFDILDSTNPANHVIQLLRLLPVLWLLSRLQLPDVMVRVFKNVPAIIMAVVLLFFMMFIFALLGKELFHAVRFQDDSDFSKFSTSMHLLCEIMMGDSWNKYSLEGRRTLGSLGYIYFLVYYYIINFMFLRLFIAIIIYNFELSDEEKMAGQKLLWETKIRKDKAFRDKFEKPLAFDFREQFDLLRAPPISTKELEDFKGRLQREADQHTKQRIEIKEITNLPDIKQVTERLGILPSVPMIEPLTSKLQQLRMMLRRLADSTPFTMFILLVVLCSTVLAVINTPGEDPIIQKDLEKVFDLIFMGIFGLEAVVKIFCYGNHPFSPEPKEEPGYFRRGWDSFDFLIILFQILDLLVSFGVVLDADSPTIAWLKGLRALRIVRVIPRLMKMGKRQGEQNPIRIATSALGASVPEIAIIFTSLILFMFFMSLVGMDLFMGFLYRCTDTDEGVYTKHDCKGVYQLYPEAYTDVSRTMDFFYPAPRVWFKPEAMFDDIFYSIRTLYLVLNRGGLADIARSLMAITSFDGQPAANFRMENLVFILFFQVVGGVFVSQMVIGIIVNNLRLKSGSGLYTDLQRSWKATQLMIDTMEGPKRKTNANETAEGWAGVVLFMRRISTHPGYEYFMTIIILVNCGFQAASNCDADERTNDIFGYADLIFLALYLLEIVFKGIASPRTYFTNAEDLSDIFITLAGAVEICLNRFLDVNVGLGVLKLFRMLRILRRFDQMQQQLRTIVSSVGGIGAATFLLAVWIFMFAAIGSRTYGRVKSGEVIANDFNFRSMPAALLILFQVATGENWDGIMNDCMIQPPYCTSSLPLTTDPARATFAPHAYDSALGDCGTNAAWVFFFIFVFGVNYMLLPLYIASVITFFYETNNRIFSLITPNDVGLYRQTWEQFVGGGKEVYGKKDCLDKMPFSQLRPFTETLLLSGCRLGVRKNGDAAERLAFKRVERQCRLAGQSFMFMTCTDEKRKGIDPFDDQQLFVDYYELIVYLAACKFEPSSVTVVDVMFREKSTLMFEEAARWIKPEEELGKKHDPWRDYMYGFVKAELRDDDDEDADSVDSNTEYVATKRQLSFNLYKILQDVVRYGDMEVDHYKRLVLLVEINDERLYVAYEEYLEDPNEDNLNHFLSKAVDLVRNWKGNELVHRRDNNSNFAADPKALAALAAANAAGGAGAPADPNSLMGQMQGLEKKALKGDVVGVYTGAADMTLDAVGNVIDRVDREGALGAATSLATDGVNLGFELGNTGVNALSEGIEKLGVPDLGLDNADEPLDLSQWPLCPHCGHPVHVEWKDCPNEACKQPLAFAKPASSMYGNDDFADPLAAPPSSSGVAQLGLGGVSTGLTSFFKNAGDRLTTLVPQKQKEAAPLDHDEGPPPADVGGLGADAVDQKRQPGQSRRRNRG